MSDEGPGIPEDELEALFTKFYRREVSQPSGTGLGLWISRNLAEAHGGALVAPQKRPAARALLEFLRSAAARPIWETYGFTAL